MSKLFIFLTFIFYTSITYAGNEVGNGGIGFWCPESNSYLLLDFYEHELLTPDNKIAILNKEYTQILQEKLSILSKLDAKNTNYYLKKVENILSKINFLEEISLSATNDSFEVAHPKNCIKKQFAIQKKRDSDHHTDFYFDKKIWESLNHMTKAGLILHEVIYEHFAYLGEKNSIKVRKFNSFIFSNKFERMTTDDYKKYIQDLKVPLY